MQFVNSLWPIGLPVFVLACSAFLLVAEVRSSAKPAPVSRSAAVFAVLVWLMLAGEAALGERRPVFEREWKGAAAVLLALAGIVHLWRRRRPSEAATASALEDQPARGGEVRFPSQSVKMPPLGKDVVEGTVTRWLKQIGDRVEAGEPLVEISTDKAAVEIPAETSGELSEIWVPAGKTASVGSTIAVIETIDAYGGGRRT